jgi:hypothetical protein
LKQAGNASDATMRDELIKLTRDASSYNHAKAKCDLPPKIDG